MNTPFRVMIASSARIGTFTEPKDFNDFNEFVEYLEDNGIREFSLRYNSIMDDLADVHKDRLTPDVVTDIDFQWLALKSSGQSKYLEITRKDPNPYVPDGKMMHKTLMPFKEKQVRKYFNNVSAEKHLQYFRNSIERYGKYEADKANCPNDKIREYRQSEKDERFFTTRYFTALFERKDRNEKLKALLLKAFGEIPPFEKGKKYPTSWDTFLNNESLSLVFERDTPAPKQYKEYLGKSLHKRHFVPYVIEKGTKADKSYRQDLEGATQVDAYIEGKNGFKLFIEAKFLSDISCDVSYDVTRNQLARNIDVMLDSEKEKSLFLLLTPKYFKDHPHTRLYGYKMNEYTTEYRALMEDLHHRTDVEPLEWKAITERIAWITWEDLDELDLKVLKMLH
jgi:hypothetical protein